MNKVVPKQSCLIILHLATLNQLGLLLNLLERNDRPLLRTEAPHLRLQVREKITLGPDQQNEQMFVVVNPSVLSGYGLHFLRVDHYSELELDPGIQREVPSAHAAATK